MAVINPVLQQCLLMESKTIVANMDAEVLSARQDSQESKWQCYADNFDHLCRLCLSQERLVAIYYNVQGRNVYYIRNFVKLALDMLKIKINKHDALPNFLCEKCERNLNIISNFKRKCDESMKLLNGIRDGRSGRDECERAKDTPAKTKRRRKAPTKRVKQDCADILKKVPKISLICMVVSLINLLRTPSITASAGNPR
uniref:ZAD domain-containing protein n=1 Tax=Anopheles maculatus TaxID=74869 RepID=A0A182SC82_9DIPT